MISVGHDGPADEDLGHPPAFGPGTGAGPAAPPGGAGAALISHACARHEAQLAVDHHAFPDRTPSSRTASPA